MPDFTFNCPNCKQSLEVTEELLGQQINCPSCKRFLKLPDSEPMKVDSVGTPYPAQVPPQPSGLAIASLILAVMYISIPAVICGHIARKRIRTSKGRLGGAGLAMAGLVLGYIGFAFGFIVIASKYIFSITNIQVQGEMAGQVITYRTMATIRQAMQLYGLSHNNELPDALDELTIAPSEDFDAPLDKNGLSDSWGQPIEYKKVSKVKYELRSGGPDKQIGTEDDLTY